ncbi:MAG: DUF983 domain-containing protein [Ahrensia sp.]|nr:DUF983 domain-containing protein [Ahrensia sp.]
MSVDDQYPPLKPEHTGLRGKCPRCGTGKLFSGFLTVADHCPHCGLDNSFAEAGDGPAFFAICLAIVPVTAFAMWMEVSMHAPYWLNALLTAPLLIAACLLPMRPLKGYLIASQYVLKAQQGCLENDVVGSDF